MQQFSDLQIQQTIEALSTQGQEITPWAVQAKLGGGDFLRIQQIIERHLNPLPTVPEPSDPQQDTGSPRSAVQTTPAAQGQKQSAPEPLIPEQIIDKEMPSAIEATMYQMQKTFGQMASQLWTDVASSAETQVQGKLQEARQAQTQAEKNKEQMQQTITQLSSELETLEVNLKTAHSTIEEERQFLVDAERHRDNLLKNVSALEEEKQELEQAAFDANIKAAKAEGLADIVKEQLDLSKQAEQQTQKALDHSENRAKALDKELQNTVQTLEQTQRKAELIASERDNLVTELHTSKLKQAAEEALRQEIQNRQIPQYSEPAPVAVAPPPAPPKQVIPPIEEVPPPQPKAVDNQQITDLGHSLVLAKPSVKSNSSKKARSLSDKLFERKIRQPRKKN